MAKLLETKCAPRERLCTALEIADLLSVTPKWVYAACRVYGMPYYQVGRYVRFAPSEVFEWLQETGAARQSITY